MSASVLGTYASLAVVLAASVVAGQATLALCGWRRWSWLAPAVGLAILIALAGLLVRLPGHAATAAALLGLVVITGAWFLRGRVDEWRAAIPIGLPVAALALLAASIPYIAAGRMGVLGLSVSNDTASHLFAANWLADPSGVKPYLEQEGYPLGPHSLVTSVAEGIGAGLPDAFSGLLLAIVPITALASLAVLGGLSPGRRLIGGTLVALPYLGAAFFAQGLFKETLQALLLLAFVLLLHDAPRRAPITVGVPAGILALGSVWTYGFPGLMWFGGALGVWAVAEWLLGGEAPSRARLRRLLGAGVPAAAIAAAILVVATVPEWGRIAKFAGFTTFDPVGPGLGNLFRHIEPYTVLGIWFSADFRLVPVDSFTAGALSAVAAAAAGYGLIWWLRRGELLAPAALAAAFMIFFASRAQGTAYTSSKALAVPAALLMLLVLRALLSDLKWPNRRELSHLAIAALTVIFIAGAAWSTFIVLRQARVGVDARSKELESLRPLVAGRRVLFLGRDDFAAYELRGAEVTTPVRTQVETNRDALNVETRSTKASGQSFPPLDFDLVTSKRLDGFDFAITTTTSFESEPPPNFERVRQGTSYELWRRQGRTPRRETLLERGLPTEDLACEDQEDLAISRRPGIARVIGERPRVGVDSNWRDYNSPPDDRFVSQDLDLPPGRWQISLQYESPEPLTVRGPGLDVRMPPALDRDGPLFAAGEVMATAGGPTTISVSVAEPPLIGRLLGARSDPRLGFVGAWPLDAPRRTVPLSEACGQQVDWYQPATDSAG